MTEIECRDPVNALLPWYLNGSLEGDEEASVRDHVDACAVCARELGALSDVSRALSLHGMPDRAAGKRPAEGGLPVRPAGVPPGSGRAGWAARLGYALAAVLAMPALLGLYWIHLGLPREPRLDAVAERGAARAPATGTGDSALRPLASLDLGPGLLRGSATAPSLHLPRGLDAVAISFIAPIDPGPGQALELRGPDGWVLARDEPIRGRDAMGRCTYTVPAALLAEPGQYDLIVQGRSHAGEQRDYRFPFRVAAGPAR